MTVNMNQRMWQLSEKLASRPYRMLTFLDKTTGGEPVYVALIPELPGCHTHGDTVEEAIELINQVKVEFIYFLLDDGLDVPEPKLLGSDIRMNFGDFLDNVFTDGAKPPVPRAVFLASGANV